VTRSPEERQKILEDLAQAVESWARIQDEKKAANKDFNELIAAQEEKIRTLSRFLRDEDRGGTLFDGIQVEIVEPQPEAQDAEFEEERKLLTGPDVEFCDDRTKIPTYGHQYYALDEREGRDPKHPSVCFWRITEKAIKEPYLILDELRLRLGIQKNVRGSWDNDLVIRTKTMSNGTIRPDHHVYVYFSPDRKVDIVDPKTGEIWTEPGRPGDQNVRAESQDED